jgi:1-acyl-sn-glycerol-3-phosphate acyltransferase
MLGLFSGIRMQAATIGRVLAQGGGTAGPSRREWLIVALLAIGATVLLLLRAGRRQFPEARADFGLLWFINRFWAVAWYRLRRVGSCTVPRTGPVILTANHGSTADPLLLYATCPHRLMGFLIAREYAHLPVLRYFTDVVRCIPVNRDGHDTAATRAAIRRLREGRMLGIFIEGRISQPGQPEPPKDGVALLALRSGARVVPAYISGLVYRDGVAASFFARHRARVRYGPPVDLSEFVGHDRETLRRATGKIQAAIGELREQARAAGERVETSPRSV